ncbi:hypothetical protein [Nonomuraea sp. NPDC049625]
MSITATSGRCWSAAEPLMSKAESDTMPGYSDKPAGHRLPGFRPPG